MDAAILALLVWIIRVISVIRIIRVIRVIRFIRFCSTIPPFALLHPFHYYSTFCMFFSLFFFRPSHLLALSLSALSLSLSLSLSSLVPFLARAFSRLPCAAILHLLSLYYTYCPYTTPSVHILHLSEPSCSGC